VKIKSLLETYPNLINRSDRCRELNCTPEQALAIINFIDTRNAILRSHSNEKHRKIISAAAFDYAFGLKELTDEIDNFGE
jgi:hypothetical protein